MSLIKILLLVVYTYPMDETLEELGVCSITSVLRENGFEVLLMGKTEDRIDYDRIRSFKPNLMGFPVYNVSKNAVFRVISRLKEMLPTSMVCVGGNLPTFYGYEMMEENADIDFAIKGEGELTMAELAGRLSADGEFEQVKGLIYRDANGITVNENRPFVDDLNRFPWPARDLLLDNKLKFAQVYSSRGCTRHCSFCCSSEFWKKWRGKEIADVIDEVEHIVDNYHVNMFYFIDSSFEDPGINCRRVGKFADEILCRNINISYYIYIRADFYKKISEDLIGRMKKSGLCGVMLGVDTANEFDLALYEKTPSLEDGNQAIEFFSGYGVVVSIGFINLNPYSTFTSLRTNIRFLERYGFACVVPLLCSTYRLYKGTTLFEKIQRDGLLIEDSYDNFYKYRFVNESIGKMGGIILSYIAPIMQECSDVYYYSCDYKFVLCSYKKLFEKNNLGKACEIITEFVARIDAILLELNQRNAELFYEIIDSVEKHGSTQKVIDIMERSCIKEYTKSGVKSLQIEKIKLHRQLFKEVPVAMRYIMDE